MLNNKLPTKPLELDRHLEKMQHNTYGKYVINVSSNENNYFNISCLFKLMKKKALRKHKPAWENSSFGSLEYCTPHN